jgi:hypothetical protein
MLSGLLSDQVIVDIVVAKYCDALPLNRQNAMLKRDLGLQTAVSTLDNAVMRVGEMLNPIISCMRGELLAGSYLRSDETPVDVKMRQSEQKSSDPSVAIRLTGEECGFQVQHGSRRQSGRTVPRRLQRAAANRRFVPCCLNAWLRQTEAEPGSAEVDLLRWRFDLSRIGRSDQGLPLSSLVWEANNELARQSLPATP